MRRSLSAAKEQALQSRSLITFGVRPRSAATGYGYVEVDGQVGDTSGIPVFAVARFVEKPNAQRAAEFVQSKRFYWNSGMFVWSTEAILAALAAHAPEVRKGLQRLDEGRSLAEVYADLPALPIDVAVMERADNVRMMPIDYEWNDVGSWPALAEIAPPDEDGNWRLLAEGAQVVAEDAEGCIAFAEGRHLVALLGVRDLVVVRTKDATLVCPRDRCQDVKDLVARLREEAPDFL